MTEYITLDAYVMGRHKDYEEEWKEAYPKAVELLGKVNALLTEINWPGHVTVSSGFRPAAINRRIRGAAKHSLHRWGMAVDIADPHDVFKEMFKPLTDKQDSGLLRKYGLFMEHPDHTKGWVHLDMGFRLDRPTRVFVPS
jgi:hypothetical protein